MKSFKEYLSEAEATLTRQEVCEQCGAPLHEGYDCDEGVSTDYQQPMEDGTGGQMFGNTLEEDDEEPAAYRAILHRIMMQHPTLLAKYGPAKVMDAAREEAMFYGNDNEIGTSDISALVKRVEQELSHTHGVIQHDIDETK